MAESGRSDYEDRRSELKKKLLRKAWAGNASVDAAEMMRLISRITQENRNGVPAEHAAILAELEQEDKEAAEKGQTVPRAVKMLNAHARHEGQATRYKDAGAEEDSDNDGDGKRRRTLPPHPTLQ